MEALLCQSCFACRALVKKRPRTCTIHLMCTCLQCLALKSEPQSCSLRKTQAIIHEIHEHVIVELAQSNNAASVWIEKNIKQVEAVVVCCLEIM